MLKQSVTYVFSLIFSLWLFVNLLILFFPIEQKNQTLIEMIFKNNGFWTIFGAAVTGIVALSVWALNNWVAEKKVKLIKKNLLIDLRLEIEQNLAAYKELKSFISNGIVKQFAQKNISAKL